MCCKKKSGKIKCRICYNDKQRIKSSNRAAEHRRAVTSDHPRQVDVKILLARSPAVKGDDVLRKADVSNAFGRPDPDPDAPVRLTQIPRYIAQRDQHESGVHETRVLYGQEDASARWQITRNAIPEGEGCKRLATQSSTFVKGNLHIVIETDDFLVRGPAAECAAFDEVLQRRLDCELEECHDFLKFKILHFPKPDGTSNYGFSCEPYIDHALQHLGTQAGTNRTPLSPGTRITKHDRAPEVNS